MKLLILAEVELTSSTVEPMILESVLDNLAEMCKQHLEANCRDMREEGITGEDWESHRAEMELKFERNIVED